MPSLPPLARPGRAPYHSFFWRRPSPEPAPAVIGLVRPPDLRGIGGGPPAPGPAPPAALARAAIAPGGRPPAPGPAPMPGPMPAPIVAPPGGSGGAGGAPSGRGPPATGPIGILGSVLMVMLTAGVLDFLSLLPFLSEVLALFMSSPKPPP